MKSVNILLITNENQWKADFVNFHMTRLHCKKALDKCTKTISQDINYHKRLPPNYGHANVNSAVRICFTLKDQEIVLISASGTRERKKSHWTKTLAGLTHVDAVLCMLSSQYPTKTVTEVFDSLLDIVERDVLKRTYFVKCGESISLEKLNEDLGAKFKVTFTERNFFEYNYPVFPKKALDDVTRGCCILEWAAATVAIKSFDVLFKRIRKLANGRSARHAVFPPGVGLFMRRLHELFDALGFVFMTLQLRLSIGLKCSDKGNKAVTVVCNKNCDVSKMIATECPFESYYAGYYEQLFEDVVGNNQLRYTDTQVNEKLSSLIVRCLSLITLLRKKIVACDKDPYIEYILAKTIDKETLASTAYELLYKLYKAELETPPKDEKAELVQCLAELLQHPNITELLETKNITRINLRLLREWISSLDLQVKTKVKEKTTVQEKKIVQEVNSAKESDEIPRNGGTLESLCDLKKTITEFTEEMTELRQACSKNNGSVCKLAADFEGVRLSLSNLSQ